MCNMQQTHEIYSRHSRSDITHQPQRHFVFKYYKSAKRVQQDIESVFI